jgi:hypothetical protein
MLYGLLNPYLQMRNKTLEVFINKKWRCDSTKREKDDKIEYSEVKYSFPAL